jgi:hypothetical protein
MAKDVAGEYRNLPLSGTAPSVPSLYQEHVEIPWKFHYIEIVKIRNVLFCRHDKRRGQGGDLFLDTEGFRVHNIIIVGPTPQPDQPLGLQATCPKFDTGQR